MAQRSVPAVFMRGGTSKALMLQARDLPEQSRWTSIFTAAMGSPDPYGRQLDGMGGGVSSLSKVCVVAPSARPDADVDYTFAQVLIGRAEVDYSGNCGNMSSAVGPFAVEDRLVAADGDTATVRIFNTNTSKLIHATFPLADAMPRYDGPLAIPGVAGTGAPVRLDFLDPGGATTGRLLPTGQALDRLDIPGFGPLDVSMVDAANAVAFVRARDLGLGGTELPEDFERRPDLLALLQAIRIEASVRMGIAPDAERARQIALVPFIALVAPPAQALTLSGATLAPDDMDLLVRAMSSGQPHRALPLTLSLCTGVAARIEGTVVAEALPPGTAPDRVRLGMPSGVLTVNADVAREDGAWVARSGAFFRTARRLFDGRVWVPETAFAAASGHQLSAA